MSNRKNPYLFYTEYYLISSAYRVVNVLNDILTYSASYSDNVKGYLHSRVVSKQIMLNEMMNHNNNAINNGNNNDDVDEDGFIVIKMRKSRIKNNVLINLVPTGHVDPADPLDENKNIECNCNHNADDNGLQIVRNMLNDILDRIDSQEH
jgi:hypothetical protein